MTKGQLRVEVLHRGVWLWDGKEAQARHWHLIVRREIKAREQIKYSLSNAAQDIRLQPLAQMQGQRYWVDRLFRTARAERDWIVTRPVAGMLGVTIWRW